MAADGHGGFFDHVSPPTVVDDRAAEGFDQLGFRVPTLVVAPYVKAGHVSSVVRDHTSALRHLQLLHGLGDMGMRTAAANDLSEHDVLRLADEHAAWVGKWDLRPRLPETMKAIAARASMR